MSSSRAAQLWIVNVVCFVLAALLASTGLINWWLLPRGTAARGFLSGLRHGLMTIHEWSGLLFILAVVVHLALHWGYIRSNLARRRTGA
jgi:hypothetical protein